MRRMENMEKKRRKMGSRKRKQEQEREKVDWEDKIEEDKKRNEVY
jgi:hypothetical protein